MMETVNVTVVFLAPPSPAARASVGFACEVHVLESDAGPTAARIQRVIAGARFPLVLVLESEDVVSPALAGELASLLTRDPTAAAYRVPRHGRYLERSVDIADWQGAGPVRVFDRRSERRSASAASPPADLRGELVSERAMSLQTMLQDIARASREVGGGPPSGPELVLAPIIELWRSFWRRGGFNGGWAALFLATMDSCYRLVSLGRRYARATGADDGPAASRA